MFCKHDWHVLSEKTTESQYEHSLKVCKEAGVIGSFKLPGHMCDPERKYILVVTCKKCGNLKRFVESI